jgi:tRNA pseudouridine65 synthase
VKAPPLIVLGRGADWLVVGKPSGLIVHRTAGSTDRDAALQRARTIARTHVNAVHRLDRAASGCLLFATTTGATRRLQAALHAPETFKTYLALVRGRWTGGDGDVVIESPVKMEDGSYKDALTIARCVATSDAPRCSLVLARPLTGRFHQVRRHLRDLNHPIIGDTVHGDSRVNRLWREEHRLGRLALHALALSVDGPDPIDVFCPLPDDLSDVLATMPWWPSAVDAVPALAHRWPATPDPSAPPTPSTPRLTLPSGMLTGRGNP